MIHVCEKCGISRNLNTPSLRIVCNCGFSTQVTGMTCQHLGEQIAKADGSCSGKRDVFQCKLFNEPCWSVGCSKPWVSIKCDPPLQSEPRSCEGCELNSARLGAAILPGEEWWFPAVTSLSPNEKDTDRQWIAMNSWRRLGMSIVAVQATDEVNLLRSRFPQVQKWIACDDNGTEYSQPTQRINRLADVAIDLNQPVMIINSDIEIYDPDRLSMMLAFSGVSVGIRHNYLKSIYESTREPYGLDVFVLHPDHVKTLPRMPFSIGKPMWDYWLPGHFRDAGVELNFVGEPLFFHRLHDQRWTQEEWDMGAKWFSDHYGHEVFTPEGCKPYRQQFPFPPS